MQKLVHCLWGCMLSGKSLVPEPEACGKGRTSSRVKDGDD